MAKYLLVDSIQLSDPILDCFLLLHLFEWLDWLVCPFLLLQILKVVNHILQLCVLLSLFLLLKLPSLLLLFLKTSLVKYPFSCELLISVNFVSHVLLESRCLRIDLAGMVILFLPQLMNHPVFIVLQFFSLQTDASGHIG